ncbi:tyrosine-protein kinase-like otk [Synchiropus splendidus]|uniref:tyrosine-protein kinase-like otk n=1 Tax=Synchiropus splendidus TaxID=270530 RepID=UPI00237E073D|nr:tyrosine-protein kinase-like otk [Synchiropus splendidus]
MTGAAETLLLLALISIILADVLQRAGRPHYFSLDETADFCWASKWTEYILRSVGESLELNCSHGGGNETNRWGMTNSLWNFTESPNSTLLFPSLTLGHTGDYSCRSSDDGTYSLYVCPEPEPPAVEHFTGGENLTLHCGDWNQPDGVQWFRRSNRTDGRVFVVTEDGGLDNMDLSNSSLVIRNVSLQDSGQVWCVVMRGDLCVFRSETLVKLREPEVDPHLLRFVLLSAVVLMMLCVVGVVGSVVWRGRRREQSPAPVEELEICPSADRL